MGRLLPRRLLSPVRPTPSHFEGFGGNGRGSAPVPESVLTAKSDHSVPDPDAPFEGFVPWWITRSNGNRLRKRQGAEFTGDVSWAASAILISFGLLPANGSQHRVSVRQSGPALLPESAAREARRVTFSATYSSLDPRNLTFSNRWERGWNAPSILAISVSFRFRFSMFCISSIALPAVTASTLFC